MKDPMPVKDILKTRKYAKKPRKSKVKRKKADITAGWKLNAGVWTHPKFEASIDDKSILRRGVYAARVMRGRTYHYGINFKSLPQAIGWVIHGK